MHLLFFFIFKQIIMPDVSRELFTNDFVIKNYYLFSTVYNGRLGLGSYSKQTIYHYCAIHMHNRQIQVEINSNLNYILRRRYLIDKF